MSLGLVGQKQGMTRVFTEDGASVPVTVIEVQPNQITQVKSVDKDGYRAVQVTTGSKHRNRIRKSEAGIFAKNQIESGYGFWEFRLDEDSDLESGNALTVKVFAEGQFVDISGATIGKGYAGAIKRHNFRSGDATHGNSLAHRVLGSTGQCQFPGKVFKGKRMPGQMGNANRTIQNLQVVRVDEERNLLLVKGSVPGARGGQIVIKPSKKRPSK